MRVVFVLLFSTVCSALKSQHDNNDFSINGNDSVIFTVDGIPVDNVENIHPDDLDSVYVLKEHPFSSKGVVAIITKKYRYSLSVDDPGFYDFCLTQPPGEHFSSRYLKRQNATSVIKWNSNPRNPYLNYDAKIDYGFDVEYKLYLYFKYKNY